MDEDINKGTSWFSIISGLGFTILAVFAVAATVNFFSGDAYENPRFTIAEVLRVDEEEDLVYKYRVNGKIEVGHKVHEFQGTDYTAYYQSVGKYFLVQYNNEHPCAVVLYLSCQLPDTLPEPDSGWLVPPV